MGLFERDFLKRQLESLGKLVASLAGLKERPEEARDLFREAVGDMLGLDDGVLERLDGDTLAKVLGAPERRRLFVELEHARAKWQREIGEVDVAEWRERRAEVVAATVGR